VNRRIYDDDRHAQFITFTCYKRRKLLETDPAKRIVIGTLGAQLATHRGMCIGFVISCPSTFIVSFGSMSPDT
jgi:hypothetical protein